VTFLFSCVESFQEFENTGLIIKACMLTSPSCMSVHAMESTCGRRIYRRGPLPNVRNGTNLYRSSSFSHFNHPSLSFLATIIIIIDCIFFPLNFFFINSNGCIQLLDGEVYGSNNVIIVVHVLDSEDKF
jgi:hypothetical protein